jgi:F-type H+-transporting ATPase subunit b
MVVRQGPEDWPRSDPGFRIRGTGTGQRSKHHRSPGIPCLDEARSDRPKVTAEDETRLRRGPDSGPRRGKRNGKRNGTKSVTQSPTKNRMTESELHRIQPEHRRANTATIIVAGLVASASLIASPALAAGKLNLVPDLPILATLLVIFVVLILPLNKLIFEPLFGVLDERREKIDGARDRAKRLEADAEESITRYRSSLREARGDAETARQSELGGARAEQTSITTEAKTEADTEIMRARGEIDASLEEARTTLRESSADLARVAAERILGRPLS